MSKIYLLASEDKMIRAFRNLSDCEDDPAEGAVLNQVTQSISRFGQREGLAHDRFDRAGLKQRNDSLPGVLSLFPRLAFQRFYI